MAYNPCSFDRKDYLEHRDIFEKVQLEDAQNELCEMNDDAEDLAFELAYTRYALAKLEASVCCFAREEIGNMNFESDTKAIDYIISFLDT